MKIKFRNEKGQYCSENVNHGFEVEMPFCTITAKRGGQQSPELGNAVCVQLHILKKDSNPIYFNIYFLDLKLNTGGYGFWQNPHKSSRVLEQTFCAKTWREAFKDAKDYVLSEVGEYENLEKERGQALIDAEF